MHDLNLYGMFRPVDIQIAIYNFSNNWMMLLFDKIAWHVRTHPKQHTLLCMVHSDSYVLTDSERFITELEHALEIYDVDWRIREWHLLILDGTHSPKQVIPPFTDKPKELRASNIFGMWLRLSKFGIEDI